MSRHHRDLWTYCIIQSIWLGSITDHVRKLESLTIQFEKKSALVTDKDVPFNLGTDCNLVQAIKIVYSGVILPEIIIRFVFSFVHAFQFRMYNTVWSWMSWKGIPRGNNVSHHSNVSRAVKDISSLPIRDNILPIPSRALAILLWVNLISARERERNYFKYLCQCR